MRKSALQRPRYALAERYKTRLCLTPTPWGQITNDKSWNLHSSRPTCSLEQAHSMFLSRRSGRRSAAGA